MKDEKRWECFSRFIFIFYVYDKKFFTNREMLNIIFPAKKTYCVTGAIIIVTFNTGELSGRKVDNFIREVITTASTGKIIAKNKIRKNRRCFVMRESGGRHLIGDIEIKCLCLYEVTAKKFVFLFFVFYSMYRTWAK